MSDALKFATARATYEMTQADLESLPAGYEDVECDYLVDIMSEALEALLLCPAPDWAALAHKLDIFAAHDCFSFSSQIRDPLFAALQADVKRLSCRGSGAT